MEAFDGIVDLLRNDGSIITNKNLAFRIGKNEADIYSELMGKYLYFKRNNGLTHDGYFFNTVDNLRLDTTLKAKQQRKAIKKLKKIDLIKTDLRGSPPKRHFKPIKDLNILSRLIEEGRIKRQELKQKLAEKGDISKNRFFGGIKDAESAELNRQNMPVNYTNLNNTKEEEDVKLKIPENIQSLYKDAYDKKLNKIQYNLIKNITTDTALIRKGIEQAGKYGKDKPFTYLIKTLEDITSPADSDFQKKTDYSRVDKYMGKFSEKELEVQGWK